MKILMVLTSHDQLGDTGKKTGFWLEELAAPYYVFKDAGAEITLASPQGGQPPLDPEERRARCADRRRPAASGRPGGQAALATTRTLASSRGRLRRGVLSRAATARCGTWPKTATSIALIEATAGRRQAGGGGLPRARRAAPRQGARRRSRWWRASA